MYLYFEIGPGWYIIPLYFILIETTGDEIDFEFVQGKVQTTYFKNGIIDYTNGIYHPIKRNKYNTLAFEWTPFFVKWYINNKQVRLFMTNGTFPTR